MIEPRYPIYIISKGRADSCLTARLLLADKVPFKLVIEPQETAAYEKNFDKKIFLILPFRDLGLGSISARNWVWEHAKAQGFERHWILDDNIAGIKRRWNSLRVRCHASAAFAALEDFTDRYENVAISGMAYVMFAGAGMSNAVKPVQLNAHVYSCLLIKNDLPNRWRGRYNEDSDLCLQVLAGGWCTLLFNAFLIKKKTTMTMKGGNTDELYKADGRLRMARSLERMWPGVVKVGRRFRRPQHLVYNSWQHFDTQLKLKPGLDLSRLKPNEYGLKLKQVKKIKSHSLKKMVAAVKTP